MNELILTKLIYYLKEKTLTRRDVLFREGDPVDGLYFLKEGELEHSILHKKVQKGNIDFKVSKILFN